MQLGLRVNGEYRTFAISPSDHLLDVLRREGFFSVKEGCRQGECGACVILLDGRPVNSCLVYAAHCQDREVTTVEGLGNPGNPHILQTAFVEAGAVQCGYCTPGMILSAKALLDRNPKPSEREILQALDGNLCRCTGYVKIVEAVKIAAGRLKKGKKPR